MFKKVILLVLILVLSGSMTSASEDAARVPPQGFVAPPLHPKDTELVTRKLGEGVYALLSGSFVDNSGFVVGEKGVLVIDAHVSVGMARKIQEAVRKVTGKPILYLVNTNYHGDHTFGNDSFPVETKIVAHVKTAERMRNIDGEKEFLLPLLENDRGLLEDVQLRLPDLVFERSLRIDLGGRFVEIYHFGHGNTPGDTIVYVPEDRVAWTGNFILGQGSIPFLIEGKADEWIRSLSRFTQRLQVDAIVPGHGKMTDRRIVVRYLTYLNRLLGTIRDQIRDGRSERDALARNPLSSEFLPQADSDTEAAAVLRGFHLWNVQRVYRDLSK